MERIVERVFAALDNWGSHPVFAETVSGNDGREYGAAAFRRAVVSTAADLVGMGVGPRTPVPLFLTNSLDFPVVFLALLSIEAIPVMVKMEYRAAELTEIFANLAPEVLISEKSHLGIIKPWLEGMTVIVRSGSGLSLVQRGSERCRSIDVPGDVATINYTYRGLGYPLGAMASHGQYLHGAKVLQDGLQAESGENMLVILPMSHIFTLIGCIMVPLTNRMTAVVAGSMNPGRLFEIIERRSVRHMLSVPEFYDLLGRLRGKGGNLGSLKTFVSGGSLLTNEQYSRFGELFSVQVLHGYGLTEFTPVSRNIRNESRAGTIGPLCEGVGCELRDGEILLDTPYVTRGYYRREKETNDAFEGGLFRTGDTGRIEDGHLVFTGEKKRTRKINGNIVDLTEIENLIAAFPGIDRFRVDFGGGKLSAEVRFRGRNVDNREELRSYLIERIARYKVPALAIGAEL